ncbi:Uncharacterised protein [Edwardsiella tarda]|nr:Uncharacterised protein [Edwardsiella tarda]
MRMAMLWRASGLWLALAGPLWAQVVDTWEFPTPQAREQGLAIAASCAAPSARIKTC